MSAWLCNEEHIYEMAHYYVANIQGVTMSVEKAAKILYAANIESLECRYGDDGDDAPMHLLPNYEPIVENPMHMAKLVDCFDYQSCESPAWEDSPAYIMCRQILTSLNLPKDYSGLPEWDKAPWGFNYAEYKEKFASTMRKEIIALACTCSDGSPTLVSYVVETTENQYELGDHYLVARDMAREDGYEGPWVYFDMSEHSELFKGVNEVAKKITFG